MVRSGYDRTQSLIIIQKLEIAIDHTFQFADVLVIVSAFAKRVKFIKEKNAETL